MNSNWHTQMMVDEINKQSERDALLKETHDTLLKMQEDSKKESAIESKRFIIQTVLSVASLIVAAIAPHITAMVVTIPKHMIFNSSLDIPSLSFLNSK